MLPTAEATLKTDSGTAEPSRPEDTGQKFSPRHLTSVDALRGIAAITVVLFYIVMAPSPQLITPHWILPLIVSGKTGVTMFFVVSAFTLSISWFSRKDASHPVRNFCIRRIFRIVPLFYFLLLSRLVADRQLWHQSHSAKEIALNLSMLFNLIPGKGDGIVWASWTIGVEILFYLMFPIVVILVTTNFRIGACLIVSLALAFVFYELIQDSHLSQPEKEIFINRGFLVHLPVFVLGLVAYSVFSSQQFKRIRAGWVGVILIASALTIHITFAYCGLYPGNLESDRSV